MSEIKEHAPGTFCWLEIGTSDQDAGKRFYTELFGWVAEDEPMPNGALHTRLRLGGSDVAGLHKLDPAQGAPPHCMAYVATANADDTAKKAAELGAKVMVPPFDVMDQGRMAMLQDPSGAIFSIWEPRSLKGFGRTNEAGTTCWFELATRDTEKAKAFYTALFGWEAQTASVGGTLYTTFMHAGKPIAGMLAMTAEWGAIPPNWTVYIAVDDCDASAKKVAALGGKVMVPPTDIPSVGRFAVVQDPQGVVLSIMKMTM